ncbi:MAG TPA: glycoside hydrolase family 2 TIM barrel-domain containing protein [Verrucomicrobiae bacterium]|nr:glycoside hydrolase family 2 TIM barrel-domain containing protein [Verrucomicrobiae bacterium]
MIQLPSRLATLVLLAASTNALHAAPVETGRLYLSGRDKDNTVPWRFLCTSGAHSGVWTNLPVPSQWDVKGFGTLTYHKDATNAWNEHGLYEHDFTVPAGWTGKRVFLVFEGVMTDTSAKLNGESVGPTHQGGFYRFKYEVTKLVKPGATNHLEVDVARHSANESVNKAERLADYWVFAGIYRPVYLEAVPQQFISRVAIDAKADGRFSAKAFFNGLTNAWNAEAQIQTLDGKDVGEPFEAPIAAAGMGDDYAQLTTQISSPKQWTAETPNLYQVEVRLKRGNETIHTCKQRFGFRTFEVRDGDGLYLNGKKIILKGVNRHSFWPDSGRCLSEAVHRLDIETIKDMNGNAVRMSHYPPDVEFLDLCDELGLYVLDELAGWQNHYDNEVGPKLVREMVTRDVNHPSIIFWDNGNEGGFNTNLDRLFGAYDPQQRRVLHPWAIFSGLNTAHYLAYDKAEVAARGEPMNFNMGKKLEMLNTNYPGGLIYLPTEFIHGLYDGGAAAGLADYWSMMMSHPNCAGGFIWAFADEGIRRPDTGEIDTAGNQAPDGIVGPYREREGSFYAIKQLWSPIQILETNLPVNFDGTLTVENHFDFTDAKQCKFTWQLRRFIPPALAGSSVETISAEGVARVSGIPPGGRGQLHLDLPENFWHTADVTEGGFLAVRVVGPNGWELHTYVWPLKRRDMLAKDVPVIARTDFDGVLRATNELRGNGIVARIENGMLVYVERGGRRFTLSSGPQVAATGSILKRVTWRLRGDGWLCCDYEYTATGRNDAIGVFFDYPEQLVKRKRWLGDGPYRVWKNRLGGGTLGVWENDYNDTITGYRGWVYPEFKGFFANVRWLQLETTEGLITVVPENIPFVQVLTPEFPPKNLVGHAYANVPQCGLGFLHAIPPIGTKFKPADTTGPQGQPNVGQGEYSGTVSFYFGRLPGGRPPGF